MLRALVAIGLLGAAQAWITSQTRARRGRLGNASNNPSLQNWEDEGGAVTGGPQLASQYSGIGSKESAPLMGVQPSLAQTG